MKRDMDLVRKILFAIEQSDKKKLYDLEIENYTIEQISYHCSLLYDSGYVFDYLSIPNSFGVGRLTWEGHEFLDKIRSETMWNQTKNTIQTKGLPMVIDVIKEVSTALVTAATQSAIKGIINQ